MLLKLGGKDNPTKEDIENLLKEVGAKVEEEACLVINCAGNQADRLEAEAETVMLSGEECPQAARGHPRRWRLQLAGLACLCLLVLAFGCAGSPPPSLQKLDGLALQRKFDHRACRHDCREVHTEERKKCDSISHWHVKDRLFCEGESAKIRANCEVTCAREKVRCSAEWGKADVKRRACRVSCYQHHTDHKLLKCLQEDCDMGLLKTMVDADCEPDDDSFVIWRRGKVCKFGFFRALGTRQSPEQCKEACIKAGGQKCNYFVYGKGTQFCRWESDSACESGVFQEDAGYDIYARFGSFGRLNDRRR